MRRTRICKGIAKPNYELRIRHYELYPVGCPISVLLC